MWQTSWLVFLHTSHWYMFSLYYDVMLDFNKLRFWESEIRYVYLLYLAYYFFLVVNTPFLHFYNNIRTTVQKLMVSTFFFKMKLLISFRKNTLNSIKSESKDWCYKGFLVKINGFLLSIFFILSTLSKNHEKILRFHKNIKQHNVNKTHTFIIIRNVSQPPNQHIKMISER